MTDYSWQGTDERGRRQQGRCDAAGPAEAAAELRARGLAPLSMQRSDAASPVRFSVTADAFTLFNRNLADMTAIGLPLPDAIREAAAGMRQGKFKRALDQVETALREGKTLDQAVAGVPGAFPAYYESMLKAGGASGNLPAILSAVARNTEGVRVARRALIEALLYPLSIVVVAVVLGVAMFTLLIPLYRDLSAARRFDSPGLDLVMKSYGSTGAWMAGLAALAAVMGLGAWALLRTAAGERVLGGLPFIGRIRRHLRSARLLGALSVMLRTGVPLPRALPVALGAAGSRQVDRETPQLVAKAVEGGGLGEILARSSLVPAEVAAFVSFSEHTGEAPAAAAQVAELLTEQALAESESLFVVLVPVALLIAGAVVGGFLVATVLPYREFLESMIR
jgi:type II secretory pathway component PulF